MGLEVPEKIKGASLRKIRKVFPFCGLCGILSGRKTNSRGKVAFAVKYVCDVCGWIYDEEDGYPEGGIEPGTKWDDLPDDFVCPLCGVGKDSFSAE